MWQLSKYLTSNCRDQRAPSSVLPLPKLCSFDWQSGLSQHQEKRKTRFPTSTEASRTLGCGDDLALMLLLALFVILDKFILLGAKYGLISHLFLNTVVIIKSQLSGYSTLPQNNKPYHGKTLSPSPFPSSTC